MSGTIQTPLSWLEKLPVYHAVSGRGDMLRLDGNEGPPPPKSVLLKLLRDSIRSLTYYPEYGELYSAWAEFFGIPEDWLMPLCGADEGIRLVLQGFGGGNAVTLFPSFAMYDVYAEMHDVKLDRVALDNQFNVDSRALTRAAAAVDLVILASPNNPTGRRIPRDTLLSILMDLKDKPVLLDETYAEFCDQNGIPWLEQFPKLLILRTVSKARGLPGLRCGFLVGRPEMIRRLEALRSPYNVCAISANLASRLPAEDSGYEKRLRRAVSARRWLQSELRRRERVTYPSDAHFCLLRIGMAEADNLADFMISRSILIKNMNRTLPGFLRISVNSRKQAARFLLALDEWAGADPLIAKGDISHD